MLSSLEKSILSTITYFDVFEYPLTVLEIWKWLYKEEDAKIDSCTISEMNNILEESEEVKSRVSNKHGFYFLNGKERHIETRKQRYLLAERKYRRAILFSKMCRYVPFIRLIAICNSLGYSNARNTSDIDFFIITSGGRIWTTRLLAVWIMKLLRLRPRRGHTKDTFCFSFFLSEEHLDLSDLLLEKSRGQEVPLPKSDIYLTYWMSQITSLYDDADYYMRFCNANSWIKKNLPNIYSRNSTQRRWIRRNRIIEILSAHVEQLLLGMTGNAIEKAAKSFQLRIMPSNLKDLSAKEDTRVMISDKMLKMHNNDRRYLYWSMWRDKLEKVMGR